VDAAADRQAADRYTVCIDDTDLDAGGRADRDVRGEEQPDLRTRLEEHVGEAIVHRRAGLADDAERAAEAEVGHRRRVHVVVEPRADAEQRVVRTIGILEREEPADVEVARVVVEGRAAKTVELELGADTERPRGAAGRGNARRTHDQQSSKQGVLQHGRMLTRPDP
jgi:hypothetical protein